MTPRGLCLAVTLLFVVGATGLAEACFGARLRIGLTGDPVQALASYAAGYFIEEKTGIEPEFVPMETSPAQALAVSSIDLVLVAEEAAPKGALARPVGRLPRFGSGTFWLRADVVDDLRFFTVDRALGLLPGFYASHAFAEAAHSESAPRKAARQAVLRAD